MKKKLNLKPKLAGLLAAAMVFSMAAPGAPAYALDYGDTSKIVFDPQSGPDMSLSSYKNAASGLDGERFVATGQAGYALTSSQNFAGIPTDTFGSGARPKVPDFNGVTWPGYTFEGWYDADGRKVVTLPYAFPYEAVTTYEARWQGDDSVSFPFTVQHYRDLNNGTGWPSDYSAANLRKFGESGWTSQQRVNTPISATYRRDIPGYRFQSVLIKNNFVRGYGEPSGGGTVMEGGARINETTKAVRGSMPNDDLTVAYLYEPDTSKKFMISVRYLDLEGNQIKAPDTRSYPVEAAYTVEPPEITAYLVDSGELTFGGTTDLNGAGIVSAEDAGYQMDNGFKFTGNMPNQAITFTYKYKSDPNHTTRLTVRRVDSAGNLLDVEERRDVAPGQPADIAVAELPGYSYPPSIRWEETLTDVTFAEADNKLTVTPSLQGGTVTITYSENLTDTNYWARVEFYNGTNGSFAGNAVPKFIRKSDNSTLAQVTGGFGNPDEAVNPAPDQHYRFDGWYRANSSGSGKTGPKLADNMVINESIKLFANFEEKEGDWFDLVFVAGPHGSISGNTTIHTVIGTEWTSLALPAAHADNFYRFDGWYDEQGNRVQDTQEINSDQMYTARFTPLGLDDDGVLAMPDARGAVSSNGSGTITVSGPGANRRYALTNLDHEVLETKLGSQLAGSGFTGLKPSAGYYVYELDLSANPGIGEVLPEHVDPGSFGPPTGVTVPALGKNYKVERDTGETMKVVVEPAEATSLYAILTMQGEVIRVPGADADGWVTPDGSPRRAVLGELEAGHTYIVVAKQPAEDADPADKVSYGSVVSVAADSQASPDYTISLINGGFITKIMRDGNPVAFDENSAAIVKAGDQISLDADPVNGQGRPFKRWSGLIGTFTLADKTRRNPTITMPAGNLVLQANYEPADSGMPGGASIAYQSDTGRVALDLSEDRLSGLIDDLAGNTEDQNSMMAGIDVLYTVKFQQGVPTASASNAVKEEAGEDAARVPWILKSSLARQVGGVNKEIPDGANTTPDIKVYLELDSAARGYIDFKLWEVEEQEHGMSCTPVAMDPDPNDEDSAFTGVVSFEGKVGSSYALSYLEAYYVRIVDGRHGNEHMIKVKAGAALEDADGFAGAGMFSDYTDPVTGVVWEYRGLGKSETSSAEYDISAPVTKNLTLYVLYREADDTQWREARQKLLDQIAIAQALSVNPSISEENREALISEIAIALEAANRVYRPTVQELTDAYNRLKALVDSISGGGDNPNNPDDPDDPNNPGGPDDPNHPDTPDNPNRPDRPSGGGSGGSTGGSGSVKSGSHSFSFNDYRTYTDGIDGRWEPAGADNSQWAFVLTNGQRVKAQWANIKYNDGRRTGTYHFDADGIMNDGWYVDAAGQWYYLDATPGADMGRLIMGWYLDVKTNKWYYLNQFNGGMATGWKQLGKDWYFFSHVTWEGHPMGSLYTNETTPDGCPVDENGRWLRETP